MRSRVVLPLTLLTTLVLGTPTWVGAGNPVFAAREMLATWHEETARIDSARAMLEAAAAADGAPETLIDLARAWFLTGEFRARGEHERAAAYEHASEAARRAIAAAPRNDRAHLWLAISLGRLAEIKGVMRALALVNVIREESDTLLRLNPENVEGLILAGGLAAQLPAIMGGDRVKAEMLFKRALQVDPHQTAGRLELARLYLDARRWRDAERELALVVDEPAPTDLPRWAYSDRPRARALLREVSGHAGGTPSPQQAS
jgi:tetratricopeptide (TPR) repeat protein